MQNRYKELKSFLAWTEERDLLRPEQVTRSILESYQRWIWSYRKKNGRPLGISTQRGRLGAADVSRHQAELERQSRRLGVAERIGCDVERGEDRERRRRAEDVVDDELRH